jgi:hypothetical protein
MAARASCDGAGRLCSEPFKLLVHPRTLNDILPTTTAQALFIEPVRSLYKRKHVIVRVIQDMKTQMLTNTQRDPRNGPRKGFKLFAYTPCRFAPCFPVRAYAWRTALLNLAVLNSFIARRRLVRDVCQDLTTC